MPRKILAKSTHNSRNFQIHAAGGKINFCNQDLIALSTIFRFSLITNYAQSERMHALCRNNYDFNLQYNAAPSSKFADESYNSQRKRKRYRNVMWFN